MYPARDARQLGVLLRMSRDLDIVGDVTATVSDPSELLAWATVLSRPTVLAWRAGDSGHRYVHVSAARQRTPVRGRVTAVLPCEGHLAFWSALGLDLAAGDTQHLDLPALSAAWDAMPVAPDGSVADDPEQAPAS